MALALPGTSHTVASRPFKLNGKNYSIWKFAITKTLKNRKLEKAVFLPATDLSDEQVIEKDSEAADLLTNSSEQNIIGKILTCDTARQIWDTLKLNFDQDSDSNLENCIIAWSNTQQEPTESISDYVARYDEMVSRITCLGETLSESMKRAILVGGLNARFEGFRRVWNQTTDKSYKRPIEMLFQDESQLAHSELRQRKSVALIIKSEPLVRNKQRLSKEDFQQLLAKSTCNNCGEKGHWARMCPRLEPENKKEAEQATHSKQEIKDQVTRAFMVKTTDESTENWYADSAASTHMAKSIESFSWYQPLSKGVKVLVADDSQLEAIGIGTVSFVSTLLDGTTLRLDVSDVLHVPELSTNLVSVSKAMQKGIRVVFEKEECWFSLEGETVAYGRLSKNGLVQMWLKTPKERALVVKTDRTLDEWHKSLAHLNTRQVKSMVRHNAATGIRLTNNNTDPCTTCPKGKATRVPHPTSTRPKALIVGEQAHLDLVGPITPVSLGGNRYFLLITDEASRFRVIYGLQKKSEVVNELSDYLSLVESETGNRVRHFWSDQGSEFLNEKVRTLLSVEHVKLTTSAAYTPMQNGAAERSNRTVIEATRTLLNSCTLSKELWLEAASTAVFVLNRTTSRLDEATTPYQHWYKRKPDVGHLHPFGSPVHILSTERRSSKWDSKTVEGFLVGFTPRRNTYRLYCPSDNLVHISCNVIFRGHTEIATQMELPEHEMDHDVIMI